MSQSTIPLVGHAFEARIYAENPRNNFLPDSGSLLFLSTPEPTHIFAPPFPPTADRAATGEALQPVLNTSGLTPPAVRLEQGFTQGAQIGVFYDPMIAKLVVHGRDRTEALRVLRKALDEYKVVGVSTNIEFLRTLAGHQAFIDGEVETGFIPVRAVVNHTSSTHLLIVILRNTSTACFHTFQSQRQRFLQKLLFLLLSATSLHLLPHPLRGHTYLLVGSAVTSLIVKSPFKWTIQMHRLSLSM